jgi:hypothetical protein
MHFAGSAKPFVFTVALAIDMPSRAPELRCVPERWRILALTGVPRRELPNRDSHAFGRNGGGTKKCRNSFSQVTSPHP